MPLELTTYEVSLNNYVDSKYEMFGDEIFPDDPSGNNILYLGHFVLIGRYVGVPEHRMNSFVLTRYFMVEVKQGLINRKPNARDPNYHDDYTGLAYTRRDLAQAILDHGRNNNWNYNNVEPSKNSIRDIIRQRAKFWHRRMPGQIEHYKLCAGEPLSRLEEVLWAASIISTAIWGKGSSGMLLDLLKLKAAENPNSLPYQIARYFFKRRLAKEYEGKIENLYKEYFGERHPFTVYVKGMEL